MDNKPCFILTHKTRKKMSKILNNEVMKTICNRKLNRLSIKTNEHS